MSNTFLFCYISVYLSSYEVILWGTVSYDDDLSREEVSQHVTVLIFDLHWAPFKYWPKNHKVTSHLDDGRSQTFKGIFWDSQTQKRPNNLPTTIREKRYVLIMLSFQFLHAYEGIVHVNVFVFEYQNQLHAHDGKACFPTCLSNINKP